MAALRAGAASLPALSPPGPASPPPLPNKLVQLPRPLLAPFGIGIGIGAGTAALGPAFRGTAALRDGRAWLCHGRVPCPAAPLGTVTGLGLGEALGGFGLGQAGAVTGFGLGQALRGGSGWDRP